jgi:DNA-binding GntR family transcriptional regulator
MHPAICWMKTNYSRPPIRRATALLRERGLIITIVGRGTFVQPQPPDPES